MDSHCHRTCRRGWSTMENMYIEQLPLPKNTAPRATELAVPFVGGNITFVFSWSGGDIYLQLLFRRKRTAPLATELADPFVCGADYNCLRRRSFMVSGGHASAVTLMEDCAPTATETADPFVCGTDCLRRRSLMVRGGHTSAAVTLLEDCAPTVTRNSLSFCF